MVVVFMETKIFAFILYIGQVLGHMWIMLGTYVNVELANPLTKRTLLVIG